MPTSAVTPASSWYRWTIRNIRRSSRCWAATRGNDGFSARATPELIATYKRPHGGHAVAIAKGLDRDRAVDESGNQIGVFGRVGARPLNVEEQHKLYLRGGKVWKVSDDPRDEMYKRRVTGTAGHP